MYSILSKQTLAPGIISMTVQSARVAAVAKPGQFVIVRSGISGERIPLTIADYDAKKGTVSIVTQVVGASTRKICDLNSGDSFTDFVGPLGIASDFVMEDAKSLAGQHFLFIAGGVGAAPIYPQIKYLAARKAVISVILGARNREMIILEKEIEKICNNLYICTDDGSYGTRGFVTDVLKNLLEKGLTFDRAVAIGPMPMMKFVTEALRPTGIPLVVSLNTLMVDGTGMCGACRVTVAGKTRFACVDGPEFNAYDVNFDEALRRGTLYKTQEQEADHICRALLDWNKKKRVPIKEQQPEVRAKNFEEVCLGYDFNEARAEAGRCLQCKNPACIKACPVSINIPGFVQKIKEGNMALAARILAHDSSLAAVCGRVCPQESQCEGACILGRKNDALAIGKLERYVADWAYSNKSPVIITPLRQLPMNKRVAIVGSGPAGLACASDLARGGIEVTIFEALHKAGGVLAYGIPEFRLPKQKVLEKELMQVRSLGVHFELNVVVGRTLTIDDLLEKEGFDAVFVATGAGLPKFMGIPGENLNGVVSANEFLARNNLMQAYDAASDTPVFVGKNVVVVGGGNVAMDAARTALRLGAEVTVVYRRTEKEMPARVEEIHHAIEEGVNFTFLTNPTEILGSETQWVRGLRCIKMQLGEPDESGRFRPVEVAGSEFDLPCDMVIIALGTSPNPIIARTTPHLDVDKRQCIVANEDGLTSRPKVYAGGDAVSGAATVILAMGAGRRAAASIIRDLKQ